MDQFLTPPCFFLCNFIYLLYTHILIDSYLFYLSRSLAVPRICLLHHQRCQPIPHLPYLSILNQLPLHLSLPHILRPLEIMFPFLSHQTCRLTTFLGLNTTCKPVTLQRRLNHEQVFQLHVDLILNHQWIDIEHQRLCLITCIRNFVNIVSSNFATYCNSFPNSVDKSRNINSDSESAPKTTLGHSLTRHQKSQHFSRKTATEHLWNN
ncbi:hypothetical protein VP01_6704g1 [Puccinia sorghi]|uniref:Uncharacterized protein n=1 Tax=Puccinia sorghi TaxID=27349 RepID=A0A0L6UET6_9BASI|nr:hypothetical protein VP01_6704g1 [Puccinia sorghi]